MENIKVIKSEKEKSEEEKIKLPPWSIELPLEIKRN